MTTLELRQPRDVGGLFRDSLTVFGRHWRLLIALSAAVVLPVQLIVSGVGLEQLTSGYNPSPEVAELLVPRVVDFLVTAPIITAICVYALQAIAAGERPSPGQVLVRGFEAFTPLFAAVLLAAIGIALGLLVLIVPGIYLFVRWYFVPQTVVIDGARGPAALSRSSELVQGFWWRTFGLVVLANLVVAVPAYVLLAPFAALADSTDRALWELVGSMLASAVTMPFVALFATFLYYDLLARRV